MGLLTLGLLTGDGAHRSDRGLRQGRVLALGLLALRLALWLTCGRAAAAHSLHRLACDGRNLAGEALNRTQQATRLRLRGGCGGPGALRRCRATGRTLSESGAGLNHGGQAQRTDRGDVKRALFGEERR